MQRRRRHDGGVGRAAAGQRADGRGDRCRLPRRGCPHPLGAGARPRGRPAARDLMLLTVDVGNTNTVLGLFDGPELFESYRIKTDARVTADELALMFRGLLAGHPAPDGVAVCSTVPAVLHELRIMFERYFADVPTVVVGPGVKTGVPLLYDNPREVGPDRVVNTLAAHTLYGGPCIVVDFGTSTNFGVVSERGECTGAP